MSAKELIVSFIFGFSIFPCSEALAESPPEDFKNLQISYPYGGSAGTSFRVKQLGQKISSEGSKVSWQKTLSGSWILSAEKADPMTNTKNQMKFLITRSNSMGNIARITVNGEEMPTVSIPNIIIPVLESMTPDSSLKRTKDTARQVDLYQKKVQRERKIASVVKMIPGAYGKRNSKLVVHKMSNETFGAEMSCSLLETDSEGTLRYKNKNFSDLIITDLKPSEKKDVFQGKISGEKCSGIITFSKGAGDFMIATAKDNCCGKGSRGGRISFTKK